MLNSDLSACSKVFFDFHPKLIFTPNQLMINDQKCKGVDMRYSAFNTWKCYFKRIPEHDD